MAGYGATQDEIALVLGCKDDTLRKYFRREWELGAIEANTAMIQALYQNGVKHNNVQAQIFWAKTRCGFKETVRIGGEDGGAIIMQILTGVPRGETSED